MPEPTHISQADRAINERILAKLKEMAVGERDWFNPATMTPWMEDYYYGRTMRRR